MTTNMDAPDATMVAGSPPPPPSDISVSVMLEEGLPAGVIEWRCSTPLHARMTEGFAKGYGYALFVVQRLDENEGNTVEQRYVVPNLLQASLEINFRKHGKWTCAVILLETRNACSGRDASQELKRRLRRTFLKLRPRINGRGYDEPLPRWSEIMLRPESFGRRTPCGAPIAAAACVVELPRTLFKPHPKGTFRSDFADYFFSVKSEDGCQLWLRILFPMIFGAGFLPWLLLESTKRAVLFVRAMWLMLFGVSDWWKVGDRALEPSAHVRLSFTDDELSLARTETFAGDWGLLYTPGGLIILGLFGLGFSRLGGMPSWALLLWFMTLAGIFLSDGYRTFAPIRSGKKYVAELWARSAPLRTHYLELWVERRHRRTLAFGQKRAKDALQFQQELVYERTLPTPLEPKGRLRQLWLRARTYCALYVDQKTSD